MKKISQKRLKDIAMENGASMAFEPKQATPEANPAGDDLRRALQSIESAMSVVRDGNMIQFARADRISDLATILVKKMDNPSPLVPYKIRVTKRDRNGNIVELVATPQEG